MNILSTYVHSLWHSSPKQKHNCILTPSCRCSKSQEK